MCVQITFHQMYVRHDHCERNILEELNTTIWYQTLKSTL